MSRGHKRNGRRSAVRHAVTGRRSDLHREAIARCNRLRSVVADVAILAEHLAELDDGARNVLRAAATTARAKLAPFTDEERTHD